MKYNNNSSPIDLYDMVSPGTPSHVNTAWAIERARRGERKPVDLGAKMEKVTV